MSRGKATWLALACVGLWLAACAADPPPPPPAAVGSGPGGSHRPGGGANTSNASGQSSGGAPSSSDGGDPGDSLPIGQIGGNFAEGAGGATPNPPPLCDPEAGWGGAAPLAGISTSADERLLAMTHDELTLVFLRDDELLVADRASVAVDFASPTPLRLPAAYAVISGLALTADGLSLVLAKEDGSALAALARASRTSAFGVEPSLARFAAVNDARAFSGVDLSFPALSQDGETLFYVARSADRADVWRASGPELSRLSRLDPGALGADGGRAKLTLSVAVDQRALFVFDEALGHVVGLWRLGPESPFNRAVALDDLESAFTNADCSRLYGTRSNGDSLDIVIEEPK